MQESSNEEVRHPREPDWQPDQQPDPPSHRPLLRLHDSRFVRSLYLTVGFAALILAAAGVVLPVLPTTPFVLLAAACFARSSQHFHDRLLANRVAGPIIREWVEHRSIPRRVKRWVYLLLIISLGSSILMMPSVWHQGMLALLGVVLIAFVWRIPVREPDANL